MTGLDADGNGTIDYEDFVSWYLEGMRVGKVRKKRPPAIVKRFTSPHATSSSPGVSAATWHEAETMHREVQRASTSTTALIERLRRDRERRAASSAPRKR